MLSRTVLIIAGIGAALAITVAILLNRPHQAQPPAFQPAANPFAHAIYANGVIESALESGSNLNILPEVAGPVVQIFVQEGQSVQAGQPLFAIDSAVQAATADQQRLQAQAALAGLQELKAQPRPEALAVASAQLAAAQANLKALADHRDKLEKSVKLDPRSVSRENLDAAVDAAEGGAATVEVANRQLSLTKAGAWHYDIQNQQAQYEALSHASQASQALLSKYVVRAPMAATVLALNTTKGAFVSPQGTYDTYTQINQPPVVLSPNQGLLAVRCYVDEILLSRLPKGRPMKAEMIVRGSDIHIPLEFVRIQPYVTPKIELSSERQERVDLRVLPVIFRFRTDPKTTLYPGQMVDVYINEQ